MSGGVQLASVKGERAPSESEHSSLLHHRAGPGYDGTVGASGRGWSEAGAAPPPDRDGVSHRCGRSYAWKPFVLASIAIGAGSFAQGYDGTAIGFLLTTHFGGFVPMTSWRTGWVVSIFFLGGVLGAGCSSWMNDALGRRTPLLAAGVLTTVAALLGMTTDTFWWLICVRCLFGFAMGINNASLAIYYAEITPKAERGGVVAMTEVFFAVGGILACVSQLVLQTVMVSPEQSHNSWRILMGLEAVPGVLMFSGALRCTESPHWLLHNGASAEAERVLHLIYRPRKLFGGGCDCAERNADLADALDALSQTVEVGTLKRHRSLAEELRHSLHELGSTMAMLNSPVKRIRRALELNLVMATMPFIGIGCIPQQFVPMLLETGPAGHGYRRDRMAISRSTLLIDLACNVVYVVGSLITCVLLVDKLGRRALLCVCLFGSAVGFALDSRHLDLALAGVILGYVCRAMGVGPLHQVVGSEVVPQEIAARGKAIYAMARRGSAMLFCLFFPPLLESVGGARMFAILSASTLLYYLVVFLRLPETKGYDALEIESILEGQAWIPFSAPPPPHSPAPPPTVGTHIESFGSGCSSPRPNFTQRSAPKGRLATSRSFIMAATPDLGA